MRVPIEEGRRILTDVGEAIVKRLGVLRDEPRATAAITAWTQREVVGSTRLAEIATGLDHDAVESLAKLRALPLSNMVFNEAFRPDEYLAVARMIGGALPTEELESLFAVVRAQPSVATEQIDDLAHGVEDLLKGLADKPPFDQGRESARWLREQLSIPDDARVEPDCILTNWGIPIAEVALSSRELDAISIWGPKHGPAVVVNRNGRHGRIEVDPTLRTIEASS